MGLLHRGCLAAVLAPVRVPSVQGPAFSRFSAYLAAPQGVALVVQLSCQQVLSLEDCKGILCDVVLHAAFKNVMKTSGGSTSTVW